jgi:hypothetical protein
MLESKILFRTAKVMVLLQLGYVSFWVLAISFSHTPSLYELVPEGLLNTILPGPLWMKLNVFVHGSLYAVTVFLVFKRSPLALFILAAALLLNVLNWVHSLDLGEYNGELGAVFLVNGGLLWGMMFYDWLTHRA